MNTRELDPPGPRQGVMECVWWSEDKLEKPGLCLHHVGAGIELRLSGSAGASTLSFSDLAGLIFSFLLMLLVIWLA